MKFLPKEKGLLSELNLYSTAELASGVICSSLLTMPHFFRHVAPKIVNRLSSIHRIPGIGESKNAKTTIVPGARHSKPPPHWHDLYDTVDSTTSGSRLDTYLEVHDSHELQSPTTTTHYLSWAETSSRGEPVVASEEAAQRSAV